MLYIVSERAGCSLRGGANDVYELEELFSEPTLCDGTGGGVGLARP